VKQNREIAVVSECFYRFITTRNKIFNENREEKGEVELLAIKKPA
jgi:hypothetical protein